MQKYAGRSSPFVPGDFATVADSGDVFIRLMGEAAYEWLVSRRIRYGAVGDGGKRRWLNGIRVYQNGELLIASVAGSVKPSSV